MKREQQRGVVVLMFLAVLLSAVAYLLLKGINNSTESGRNESNASALSQAKQALVGYAATYSDAHTNQAFGYLPCPDTNNDGDAEPNCGAANISAVGRLPWKTLNLPPLRDATGECLWYAVSGRSKNSPGSLPINWDTVGQFQINDANGATILDADLNNTPWAVVFAPGAAIDPANLRTPAGTSECGGNSTLAAYLEGATIAPGAHANSTLTLSTAESIHSGTNNDQGQWINAGEIYNVIKNRGNFAHFANFVNASLLAATKDNLNALPAPVTLGFYPYTETAGGATIGSLQIGRVPVSALTNNDTQAWQDNLFYARCTFGTGCLTVNGTANCKGVLIFSGERSAGISRASEAEKNTPSNYLEGAVLANFEAGATTFTGASAYDHASPSADVLICIPLVGATEYSFASNFASFTVAGAGATQNMGPNTLTIASAAGTAGGCLWLPSMIDLAGKTVRSYLDFQFSTSDPVGGADRGNGFTLDIVDSTQGSPTASCGLDSHMGAFEITDGSLWAAQSFAIETDVRRDVADSDPASNHAAIMAYGNLQHSATNGNPTVACDGSAAGCSYATTYIFEESPSPTLHNQRIEIHSGCDSSCGTCNPASHIAPNNYVKIDVWVDCAGCTDVSADFGATPNMQRCIILDPAMDSSYIALTGGFRTGASSQGVTLSNFILRSE